MVSNIKGMNDSKRVTIIQIKKRRYDMFLDKKDQTESAEKQTNKELFEKQKQTLDLFLERKAISQVDYDKSINALKAKMKL